MKKRWITCTLAFLLLCLLIAYVACGSKSFYSIDEIEGILEEKYHIPFSVQEMVSENEEKAERTYWIETERYPDLTFQVQEGWSKAGWIAGSGGVPPVYNFSQHYFRDSCQSEVWNRYAVPILAQYGLTGLAVREDDKYYDLYSSIDEDTQYQIQYTDSPQQHARRIYALLKELNELPVFRDMGQPKEENSSLYGYYVYTNTFVEAGSVVYSVKDCFRIGYPYTEEELLERITSRQQNVGDRFIQELKEIGISESVLSRFEPIVVGADIYVTEEILPKFGFEFALTPNKDWNPLWDIAEEKREDSAANIQELYYWGMGEIDGSDYYCITDTPINENLSSIWNTVFLIDAQTGEIYQYGYKEDWGFMVKVFCKLPKRQLENLQKQDSAGRQELSEQNLKDFDGGEVYYDLPFTRKDRIDIAD